MAMAHEDAAGAPAGGTTGLPRRGETITARDPADVRALLWFVLVAALGVVAARGAEQATAGIEADLVQLVSHLPGLAIVLLFLGLGALHILLGLGIPLVIAAMRRWRLLGMYLLGLVITNILMRLGERLVPESEAQLPGADLGVQATTTWPPSGAVATAVAAVVMLSPRLSPQWRRFGWAYAGLTAVQRVVSSQDVLLDIVLAVGIGGVVGHAMLLAFGKQVTLPGPESVRLALARAGLRAEHVDRAEVTATGSLPFTATLADGRALHCKVVASTQREADRLLRGYRRVRTRELGEDVAFSSVRRAVAVEAMLAMSAAAAGARTPRVAGVAQVSPADDEMVLAFDHIDATGLDAVPAERITDDVLGQAWTTVGRLRAAGIAHRDLQLSSWMLDAQDRLWLIDFSFGEPAATDGALNLDIAELLAATFAVVGADRAVAAAVDVLGPEALATGLGHLVPVALTRPTRAAVKEAGGLAPLVDRAAEACGVDKPEFAPIERVKPRTLLMAGLLAVAVYVLLPQLADLPRMLDAIREADPWFAGAAALASVVTYIGSAMAISGACPAPLRYIHSLLTAVAATFVGAVAPPGVAHVGLNVRYYQKQGLPPAAAVSSTAAKEVGVGGAHVVLLLLLALLAGSTGVLAEELDRLPSARTVGIAVAVVASVLILLAAIPKVRRAVIDAVVPAVRHSVDALRELVASPAKMILLFAGGLLLQMGYVAALYFAVRALGGDVGIVTIGLIYLTVGSAASVAPTPGGVGAVEGVLLGALTGVGMAAAPALAAVFLYRLVTFWLPIPVGGLSMRYMVNRELV